MTFFLGPTPSEGTGWGVVLDRDGHIVTNSHVVEGAGSIEVILSDETTVWATVVGTDPLNDLAAIQIDVDPSKLVRLELGEANRLQVGQRANRYG